MSKKRYEFPVIIERDEDDIYVATVTSLPGCHTQAKTIPMLLDRIKEAILLYLEIGKGLIKQILHDVNMDWEVFISYK